MAVSSLDDLIKKFLLLNSTYPVDTTFMAAVITMSLF